MRTTINNILRRTGLASLPRGTLPSSRHPIRLSLNTVTRTGARLWLEVPVRNWQDDVLVLSILPNNAGPHVTHVPLSGDPSL